MRKETLQGWIGWRVEDARGRSVGRVAEVLVDRIDGRPQWLIVRLTWPHDQQLPVPVTEDLFGGAGRVHTRWTRRQLLDAPRIWASGLTPRVEAEACAWFGVAPTRGAGRAAWERRATSAPVAEAARFSAPVVEAFEPRPVPRFLRERAAVLA